jgi:hypothetical protein
MTLKYKKPPHCATKAYSRMHAIYCLSMKLFGYTVTTALSIYEMDTSRTIDSSVVRNGLLGQGIATHNSIRRTGAHGKAESSAGSPTLPWWKLRSLPLMATPQ